VYHGQILRAGLVEIFDFNCQYIERRFTAAVKDDLISDWNTRNDAEIFRAFCELIILMAQTTGKLVTATTGPFCAR